MFGDFPTKDKIVVVTGGGSGIGLAYVSAVIASGAKAVIIGDTKLTGKAETVIATSKDVAKFEKCDVSNWKDLQNLIDASLRDFGDVPDIYVASAGIFEPPYSNFWDDPETERYLHVDINVSHPIKLTRLAIRALLGKKKKGVVLLVASIAGYSKQYTAPIYSATKHAVVGFTRSIGDAETLQGVKVVCVCPGIVATPIWTPVTIERYEINDSSSISADTVAATMMKVTESGEYPGGTIMEISKLGERVIPEWHIDPPGMVAGEMAVGTTVSPEAIAKALGPILAVTAKETGSSV